MISFREVSISDARLILDWRTKKRVSQFMLTEVAYDISAQEQWIRSCYSKPDYYHWIVQIGGKDAGLINIVDWDKQKASASWGYYIGDDNALGFGGMVPPLFYNFCFNTLGIKLLSADVFYSNTSTIKLHLLHGYQFAPEGDHVVIKNNKPMLMVHLALHKNEFLAGRYAKHTGEFPMDKWVGKNNEPA